MVSQKRDMEKLIFAHLSDLYKVKVKVPVKVKVKAKRKPKERPAFDASKARPMDLVSYADIAQHMKVNPGSLRNLKLAGKFIEPDVVRGSYVRWRWWRVQEWLQAREGKGDGDE